MLRVAMLAFVCCLASVAHARSPAHLGAVSINAWLTQPRMPAIPLSRGPLQQIIVSIVPEAAQPVAHTWEAQHHKHLRLLQAAREAIEGLEQHYRHEMVLRPSEDASLKARLADERRVLSHRFEAAADMRISRLKQLEIEFFALRRRHSFHKGSQVLGNAAAHLLEAEIRLARYHEATRERIGSLPASEHERQRPRVSVLALEAPMRSLERAKRLASDRLTRERVAQLLAVCEEAHGQFDKSVALLREVLHKNVSWTLEPELRNRLGDLLLKQGKYARAALAYGAITEERGGWWIRARLGLAWTRHRRGDDPAAMVAVKEVYRHVDGQFERSARLLAAEAGRLYAELLADSGEPLSAIVKVRIRESVRALRANDASPDSSKHVDALVAKDGRRAAVATRAARLRQCYRRQLRLQPYSEGRVIIGMNATASPVVIGATFGTNTFRSCVASTLADVVSLPTDEPAILELKFSAHPATP